MPRVELAKGPSPVEDLSRLRTALGESPHLVVKRDDAITFAFGGSKVRKLELVAAEALAAGADTLLTAGGVQSNHARITAAAAARLGLRCILVANGEPPVRPSANALLDLLLGAEVRYVASREERTPRLALLAREVEGRGGRPFVIPIGASNARGALGLVRAIGELAEQMDPPSVILHATSSGGTQAGLIAGCELFEWPTRIIGISADDPAETLRADVQAILTDLEALLGCASGALAAVREIEVDDSFVGPGYGVPTAASTEAIELAARTEALFLDPTYTAKGMAALIAFVRAGRFNQSQTVLFWHTGGQVALFA